MAHLPHIESLDSRRLFAAALVTSFGNDGVINAPTTGGSYVSYGNGGFFTQSSAAHPVITRYNPDGTLDTRFTPVNTDNPVSDRRSGETFQGFVAAPDGSIYVFRATQQSVVPTETYSIQHYTRAGKLDRSFATNGLFETPYSDFLPAYAAPDSSLYFDDYRIRGDNEDPVYYEQLVHIAEDNQQTATYSVSQVYNANVVPERIAPVTLLGSAGGDTYLLDADYILAYKHNLGLDKSFGNNGTLALQDLESGQENIDVTGGEVVSDGTLLLIDGNTDLIRLTSTGQYDKAYASNGVANLIDLLPADSGGGDGIYLEPDGSALVLGTPDADNTLSNKPLLINEIDPNGQAKKTGFNNRPDGTYENASGQPLVAGTSNHVVKFFSAGGSNLFASFTLRSKTDSQDQRDVIEELTGT